jgi:tetratricopeptide (TPR) repeat protein
LSKIRQKLVSLKFLVWFSAIHREIFMKGCSFPFYVGATLILVVGGFGGSISEKLIGARSAAKAQSELATNASATEASTQTASTRAARSQSNSAQSNRPASSAEATCPAIANARSYDVIVFGDEVPGVMTALQVQRELKARGQSSEVAIVTEGDIAKGIGGHLIRGGLAYLDRNQVPSNLRSRYGTFGQPSGLYQEFLSLGQVNTIALDRFATTRNFSRALRNSGIEVVGNVDLETVQTEGTLVCAFSASGRTYTAKQFIDASQSGELAAASGVEMMKGLEALGFPNSALSIGLMFDLFDVTIEQFAAMEADLIQRYFDPQDAAAQRWLNAASGNDPVKRQELLSSMVDRDGTAKLMYRGTPDSADVRSLAFSILVHGYLQQEYDIKSSGFLFDRANIAILNDRLSFNALLFYADAETAQQLSASGGQPTEQMLAVANEVKTLFEKIGVPRVEVMDELYIRNAGQISNSLDELSATLMAAGGVSPDEALGTFGYHLDDRGGIDGLDERVNETHLRLFDFDQMPVFNYGFRHTLPLERSNLAVLGPASGFGGLGTTAGRIVEFNVSVGQGLAAAVAKSIDEERSLQSISNVEIRQAMANQPQVYGYRTDSFRAISTLERRFRGINYEQAYIRRAQAYFEQGNYNESAREIARTLTLDPRNAEAYYLRGLIQAESGNRSQARADLEQAIALYQAQGDTSSVSTTQGALETLLN